MLQKVAITEWETSLEGGEVVLTWKDSTQRVIQPTEPCHLTPSAAPVSEQTYIEHGKHQPSPMGMWWPPQPLHCTGGSVQHECKTSWSECSTTLDANPLQVLQDPRYKWVLEQLE